MKFSILACLALAGTALSTVVERATPAEEPAELLKRSSTSTAPRAKCGTAFKYTGVNEAGGEVHVIPGTLGTDYTWPSPSSIDYFMGKGMNTFRIPFLLERLVPPATGLNGTFNSAYLSGLTTIVNYITNTKGGYAVLDPHNFMIYNGATISDNTKFAGFWTNLAKAFLSNSRVIFDLMNEPHDIAASTVFASMQAAVNAIRVTGATQLILVEGTSWTGAWTWVSSGNSAAFAGLKDPANNIAIEMHQYLDSDGSGTSATCVSSTIGAERLAAATLVLDPNTQCISAITGALCSMQQSGVWIGWLFWSAGPWWGTYFQSIEPPSGPAVSSVLPAILPYVTA
ncbi:endoglucanase [Flagelloscypha sp. PMI_526]|nr:endoglucanase [Flagelloscypha sp. PMI_526]